MGIHRAEVNLELSAEDLIASARTVTTKIAGPDSWEASQLLLLPQIWWDCLAKLWGCVLQGHPIPSRWLEARIALLPKPDGSHRPLSITSMLWRIGAKAINRRLQAWAASWTGLICLGGIASRGVLDAHAKMQAAIKVLGCRGVFVSQDLSKCFDRSNPSQAATVLTHFGAPAPWVDLVLRFYGGVRKLFSSQGVLDAQWLPWDRLGRGLLQGCPFSPLIACAVMSVWFGLLMWPRKVGQLMPLFILMTALCGCAVRPVPIPSRKPCASQMLSTVPSDWNAELTNATSLPLPLKWPEGLERIGYRV